MTGCMLNNNKVNNKPGGSSMKKTLIGLSLSLGVLGLAGTTWADSWDVTQEVTIGTGTNTVEQSGANTSALQGLNVIHGVATLEKGSQEVKTGSNALTLTQKDTTGTSVQAGNLIKDAGDIGSASNTFTQKVVDAEATITLNQEATGTDNTQAVNYASAGTGNIVELEQTVTTTGTSADIALNQTTASSSQQTQAGNYAEAATINTLTQALTAGKDLLLTQSGNNDKNTQAGNYAKATTDIATGKTLAQTAEAKDITLVQSATGSNGLNLQAVNAMDTADAAGTITQGVTTGGAGKKISLSQTEQKESGQYGNYLHATGTVVSVGQTYSNSSDKPELTQTDVDSSNQALNAIEMTGSSDALTAATQTVSVDTLKMEQKSSSSTDKALQAGNLLLSATEAAEATQTVTATLDLTQEKATASVQAGNLAEAKAVTTSITQTVTGTTDTLVQGADGATTSTQAGNYLKANGGTIAAVEQTYGASTSATLTQGKITSGVQGLNVIDATNTGAELTAGRQTANPDTLDMTQGTGIANDNTTTVQAANAVITASGATGGKVTQTVTAATSLAMVQKNVSNSIQADNFAGAMPN
jgi:hypothetical protein